MDAELLKLVQQAIRDGITANSWMLFLTVLAAAGVGAFFGAYLKKKAENRAVMEDFRQSLEQMKAQTKATEEIKGVVLQNVATFTHALQQEREFRVEQLRSQLRERENRFANFHQRRVEVLTELYRRLVQAANHNFALAAEMSHSQQDPTTVANRREKARAANNELDSFFEENLVFVPDALQARGAQVIHRMRETIAHSEGWYVVEDENPFTLKKQLDTFLLEVRNEVKRIIQGETDIEGSSSGELPKGHSSEATA